MQIICKILTENVREYILPENAPRYYIMTLIERLE